MRRCSSPEGLHHADRRSSLPLPPFWSASPSHSSSVVSTLSGFDLRGESSLSHLTSTGQRLTEVVASRSEPILDRSTLVRGCVAGWGLLPRCSRSRPTSVPACWNRSSKAFFSPAKTLPVGAWPCDNLRTCWPLPNHGRRFAYASFEPPPPTIRIILFTASDRTPPADARHRLTQIADAAERFLFSDRIITSRRPSTSWATPWACRTSALTLRSDLGTH